MNKQTIREQMSEIFGFAPALKDITIISTDGNITMFSVNGHRYVFDYEKCSVTKKDWTLAQDRDGWEYHLSYKSVTIPTRYESPEYYIRNCANRRYEVELLAAIDYYIPMAEKKFAKMKDKRIASEILNYDIWRDNIWADDEYTPEDITDDLMDEALSLIGSFSSYDYDTHSIPAKIIGDIMGFNPDLDIKEEKENAKPW